LGEATAKQIQSERGHGRGSIRLRTLSVVLVCGTLASTWAMAYTHQEVGTTTGPMLNVSRGISRIPSLFEPDRLADHGDNYQYQLAKLLLRIGRPGNAIALDEVGTVAYYTSLRVVDLFGLADARIADRPGPPGSRADPDYVFGQHPRFFAFHMGNCFCAPSPDDAVYAADSRMFAYRAVAFLPEIIPDYQPVPPVVLLERDPRVASVMSLDAELPAAVRQRENLPPSLNASIAPILAETKVTEPTASQAASTALGLLGSFTAVQAGVTIDLSVPRHQGTRCKAVATGLSSGSTQPQSLTMSSTTDASGHETGSAATTVDLGIAPTARTVSLELPASGHTMLRLGPGTMPGPSTAQWAEPRIECGRAG
jgi:hypothetical protein